MLACEEEAAVVVRLATKGDGRDAYESLVERFNRVTTTSRVSLVREIFKYRQTKSIEPHVTG